MRWLPLFLCVPVPAVVAAACSPRASVSLTPVEPDQVEVYMASEAPSEEYKVIKRIEERAAPDIENRVLIERARARAAELGADALIIEEIRTTIVEAYRELGPVPSGKILKAVAIYFPSKHPELSWDRGTSHPVSPL